MPNSTKSTRLKSSVEREWEENTGHRLLLRDILLKLRSTGLAYYAIAAKLNVSPITVSKWAKEYGLNRTDEWKNGN